MELPTSHARSQRRAEIQADLSALRAQFDELAAQSRAAHAAHDVERAIALNTQANDLTERIVRLTEELAALTPSSHSSGPEQAAGA